jgi:hypothetical protein
MHFHAKFDRFQVCFSRPDFCTKFCGFSIIRNYNTNPVKLDPFAKSDLSCEGSMVLSIILAFMAGGLVGIMGMSMLSYGTRFHLLQENRILRQRLDFLEVEGEKRRFKPVHDPRPHVHSLVN